MNPIFTPDPSSIPGSVSDSHSPSRLVLRGATVVTMNSAREVAPLDVVVHNGRIEALHPPHTPAPPDSTILDLRGCVLTPGLIQTHVHLCQTLFRNLADDLALLDWLKQRIWPLEAAHNPESLYLSAMVGTSELLRGGTTTILDMGTVFHHDAVMQAICDSGIRAFSGKTMMDAPDTHPGLAETAEMSLKESCALFDKYHGAMGGRVNVVFAPRFVLSCTDGLLRELAAEANRRGAKVHTHASENREEIAEVFRRTGKRNIVHLRDVGLVGPHVLCAHGVWLDQDEIAILAETGTHILHCPSSNLKLGSGFCNVVGLRNAGVSVTLGADGAPCNNNMSALMEMRLCALLQKPIHGPQAMTAEQTFAMATCDGAKALGLEQEIGSIEVGKRADITVLNLNRLHTGPGESTIYGRIVYGARDEEVTLVMVDGHILVQNGQLVRVQTHELLHNAKGALDSLCARAAI
ncbi:MAG: 5'-deoxyadenosine deaminase [Myxococcales bacterium]|nr:5'-deoxyadenosine deaminase [Myxococcales bacterium]